MRKLLTASALALLLSGCLGLSRHVEPSFPELPQPPEEARRPCHPAAMTEGQKAAAEAEGIIRDSDLMLAMCEFRRQLLLDSWPTLPAKPEGQKAAPKQ
jgi:hypothetical protein